SVEPSHVLTSMFGKENPRTTNSIRFSFGIANTTENVQEAANRVVKIGKRLPMRSRASMKNNKDTRGVGGMCGGAATSVAALLVTEQGYDVLGICMRQCHEAV